MPPEADHFVLIKFPDGTHMIVATQGDGSYPQRGDEVVPDWIVEEIEIRDGRSEDLIIEGKAVYAEVRVTPAAEFSP